MKKFILSLLLGVTCIPFASATEWNWQNFKNYFQAKPAQVATQDLTEAPVKPTTQSSSLTFDKQSFSDALASSLRVNIGLGSAAWMLSGPYAASARSGRDLKMLATALSRISLPKYYGALTAHSLAFAGLMGLKLRPDLINEAPGISIKDPKVIKTSK